jgi:hypothetical protein
VATSGVLLMLSPEELDERLEAAAERGAARALAAREADVWLDAKAAAAYVYGQPGKEAAFRGLRHRHPQIDAASTGEGKRRRWKRTDLDAWLQTRR